MAITIEVPKDRQTLHEFVRFYDRVYEQRAVRWPALVPFHMSILLGQSPFVEGRRIQPLVARADGTIVARLLAVLDHRYNQHWNEQLGHINMFEALPHTREATCQLVDAACAWFREHGAKAARAGFGVLEFPFVIDDYESLPPSILRQNPPYYHALLKDAGFESEKGCVDYKINVRPDLVARWESALEAGQRSGYRIVPLGQVPEEQRTAQFTQLWNDAFAEHWGYSPFSEEEFALLLGSFAPMGLLDTSVIAYRGSEPEGVLWVSPETSAIAVCQPGRRVQEAEKLNFLGIGVRASARGRGVGMAMAAYAFLELIRRGATHLSYTLVLDDNWPSRRTAERLGAEVCASYLVYRRTFLP